MFSDASNDSTSMLQRGKWMKCDRLLCYSRNNGFLFIRLSSICSKTFSNDDCDSAQRKTNILILIYSLTVIESKSCWLFHIPIVEEKNFQCTAKTNKWSGKKCLQITSLCVLCLKFNLEIVMQCAAPWTHCEYCLVFFFFFLVSIVDAPPTSDRS